MRKITLFILILIILLPGYVFSQGKKSEKNNWGIAFHGFVKTDFWKDYRKFAGAREDLFILYPLNKSLDKNGVDINNKSSFNFSAITSRITGKISGPDAFNAKTSGVIEADFSGVSNTDNNGFRLRLAIAKFKWKKTELLVGQFWHPTFVTECFPTVISLNTGVPFNPFIRSPQIRFKRSFNKLHVIGAILSQRDYTSTGPAGRSSDYIRNAIIPNIHLQVQYKSGNNLFGLAGDYKVIQPETVTDSLIQTNEKIGTYAFMGYYKYTRAKLCLKFKTIYGQNLYEHLLLGGYAAASVM